MELWRRQAIVDESHMAHGRATLNGHDAVVSGFRNPFAHVATCDGSMLSAEYSWSTAERIMRDHNGAFTL